jgi:hypothetical protein
MSDSNPLSSADARFLLSRSLGDFGSDHLDWMDALTEKDLHECMFKAVVQGNIRLINLLWWHRGPFRLAYENKSGFDTHYLNGVEFSPHEFERFTMSRSMAEIRAVLETVRAFGFKGIFEPGRTYPFLFRKSRFLSSSESALRRKYTGKLPFLVADRLDEPELAMCLAQEAQCSVVPDAYQPILCWATEEMVAQYPLALAPLRPVQRVMNYDMECAKGPEYVVGKDFFDVSVAEFKAMSNTTENIRIHTMALGVDLPDHHGSMALMLFGYMGIHAARFGFSDEQGRVLCETSTDFLMGFSRSPIDTENMLACETFVSQYLPLDIIGHQAKAICEDQYGHISAGYSKKAGSRDLVWAYDARFTQVLDLLLPSYGVPEKAREMLRPDQWASMIKHCDTTRINAAKLIAVRDVLGMSNESMRLILEASEIDQLHKANYRFSDNTKALPHSMPTQFLANADAGTCVVLNVSERALRSIENYSDDELIEETVRLHGLAQQMNLWTGLSEKPLSVEDALNQIVDLPLNNADYVDPMAIMAWLIQQGVAVCASAATTSGHWQRICEIFGTESLTPHLAILPREIRGMVLEHGLGL